MPNQSRTASELAFEQFCRENYLVFEKINEAGNPRPDYEVQVAGTRIVFEVKEINGNGEAQNRTTGAHIRRKIDDARKQLRYAAEQGVPAVLLIYNRNHIDRQFKFGTEDHDFKTAMYGDYTLKLNRDRTIVNSFHGRNQSMRQDSNVEISAVGRLEEPNGGRKVVTLFLNVFATVQLAYEELPPCFVVQRAYITEG